MFCYPDVRSYLKATYPKSLPICSYNYFSIRNSLSDVLYVPLFVAAVSFFVARVEFQVGVLPPGVFRCQIFPREDLQSAFLCLLFCSICLEIAWDSPIVNIVSQTMNKQVRYNQLQKYLRHCTVFWHKWPIHDLVLLIPPPPGPLSMLLAIQDHTQNLEQQLWMGGRREVSVISQRPVTRSDLKQERSFFLWSVSTFLQLVVALHEYFGHWWEIAFSSRMLPRNETCAVTSNYCKTSWRTPSDIYMQRWALRVCSSPGSACGLRTTRALRVSGDYYLTLLGASQEIIVLLRTPTKYRSILL